MYRGVNPMITVSLLHSIPVNVNAHIKTILASTTGQEKLQCEHNVQTSWKVKSKPVANPFFFLQDKHSNPDIKNKDLTRL